MKKTKTTKSKVDITIAHADGQKFTYKGVYFDSISAFPVDEDMDAVELRFYYDTNCEVEEVKKGKKKK